MYEFDQRWHQPQAQVVQQVNTFHHIVRLLLDAGADVNLVDAVCHPLVCHVLVGLMDTQDGNAAIHSASPRILPVLLEAGADVHMVDQVCSARRHARLPNSGCLCCSLA